VRNRRTSGESGDINYCSGDNGATSLGDTTGSVASGYGRYDDVTRGKRKGVKYIIKVL
jgi:hypothetical protein